MLVYDYYKGTARRLGEGYDVSLKGFGDALLQLSPVENGWALIGRTDKYLSAAAAEVLTCTEESLEIKLHEAGPLGIWLATGEPMAEGISFTAKGKGLFVADLPVKAEPLTVSIKRK